MIVILLKTGRFTFNSLAEEMVEYQTHISSNINTIMRVNLQVPVCTKCCSSSRFNGLDISILLGCSSPISNQMGHNNHSTISIHMHLKAKKIGLSHQSRLENQNSYTSQQRRDDEVNRCPLVAPRIASLRPYNCSELSTKSQ